MSEYHHTCPGCGSQFSKDSREDVICANCGEPTIIVGASASNESDNPDHYKTGKLECIDAMRAMLGDDGFAAYLRGTIFKYNWRLGKKDEAEMEAKKIAVYTRWLNDVLAGKELSKDG